MKRDYPDRPLVGVGAVIVQRRPRGDRRALHGAAEGAVVHSRRRARDRRDPAPVRRARGAGGNRAAGGGGGRARCLRQHLSPTPTAARSYHYVLIDFFCRVVGGELKAGGDAAQARWITREELGRFSDHGNGAEGDSEGAGERQYLSTKYLSTCQDCRTRWSLVVRNLLRLGTKYSGTQVLRKQNDPRLDCGTRVAGSLLGLA